jgi:hypothetical protein
MLCYKMTFRCYVELKNTYISAEFLLESGLGLGSAPKTWGLGKK